jgi:hypothetical protein
MHLCSIVSSLTSCCGLYAEVQVTVMRCKAENIIFLFSLSGGFQLFSRWSHNPLSLCTSCSHIPEFWPSFSSPEHPLPPTSGPLYRGSFYLLFPFRLGSSHSSFRSQLKYHFLSGASFPPQTRPRPLRLGV